MAKTPDASGSAEKPVLLSGDNPQIAKGDGDEPVQAYIAALPEWKSEMGRRIDEIVTANMQDVQKAVKWNSPFYGLDGHGWLLNFHAFTTYLKVAFFAGTSLDPMPPDESKDENVRYLNIYEDGFDETQFAEWVKQSSKLPGWGKV